MSIHIREISDLVSPLVFGCCFPISPLNRVCCLDSSLTSGIKATVVDFGWCCARFGGFVVMFCRSEFWKRCVFCGSLFLFIVPLSSICSDVCWRRSGRRKWQEPRQ
ncbi:hypothetical protein Dimus_037245 [Dionaea muscipula]